MRRCCFALGLLLSLAAATARAEEPAPPSSLELAERLRHIGGFSECAVEALREAYTHPAKREEGFDRAALCLSMAGRFEDARRLMLALEAGDSPLGPRGRLRLCLTEAFMSGLGAPRCPDLAARPPADPRDARANHTLVMRAVLMRHFAEGRLLLARAGATPADAELARWQSEDRAFLERQAALPRKSPWLAAGLSAVVPGLGRVYLGRWADGLFSFVLVGVVGGFAAHGFYEDGRSSVRGWILGSTAALFYVGNVYGSAVGALAQRRDAEDTLMKEIERGYRQRLEP
jgi:TM2 domain-containing membrane protein YozV